MKVFYTDQFVLPLPSGHRFPMEKYSRLRARVGAELAGMVEMRVPEPATEAQLLRAHDAEYVARVFNGTLENDEVRRLGFPWSAALVERSRRSVGATLEACAAALTDGFAANLAGGTHHAFRDHGEGYCVFNDAAVAARELVARGHRVLVIDCDVHQGNGTASILAADDAAFTFSIHGAKNFPFRKERSNLDIDLPDGTADREYLAALQRGLDEAVDRARADIAIYIAGADPFEDDKLGRLKLTRAGLAARDALVYDACHRAHLAVAITMAGGYARNVDDTVDIHFTTIREAARRAMAPRIQVTGP